MYRLLLESLLGLTLVEGRLRIAPCVPARWDGYSVTYRHGAATYVIQLRRAGPGETASLILDGRSVEGDSIPLADDGLEHQAACVYLTWATEA
jgi:cellobiose phosphorylase